MFLAICKNNFFSCVKGHAPSLRCNVAAARCPKVWKGGPPTWYQKATSRTTRTYLSWHQRLKQKVAACGQLYRLAHNSTLDDRKSTFCTQDDRHLPEHPKPVSFSSLPNNQNCLVLKRTDELVPSIWRLPPSTCNSNLQVFNPSHGLGVRVSQVGIALHSGARGFCCPSPRKPIEEDHGTLLDPREESSRRESNAELPAPQHEHFQFKELYENPWTIPNFLCMARILLAPVLGYLIMERYFHLSLGLFILAGATDLLDGWIARNWPSQKSALGSALDPLADKILISVLYVSLTYANLIPAPLTALVIFRDVGLIAAVFYVRYKTVPPPVTLSRFFNPCYTTAQLKPTLLSKVNTAIQLFLVAVSVASPVFHYTDSVLLQSLWYITAVTTVASGYTYYHYGRKTVQILNSTK